MGKSGIKNMSRQEPCPICGKPDYCFWSEIKNFPGMYTLLCRRSSEAVGSIIAGTDGKDYVVVPNKNNVVGTFYESVQQREERKNIHLSGERKEYKPIQYTVVDSITPLPNDKLDEIYRCLMENLPLYQFHASYLLKEGWSMKLIEEHHICSFPAEKIEKLPYSLRNIPSRTQLAKTIMRKLNLQSLAGVPGADINKMGEWTFYSHSGIVFPVYDENGHIYRLRVRLDYMDLPVKMKEEKDGFYYVDNEEKIHVTMSGAYSLRNGERTYKRFSSHEGKYRNFSSYMEDKSAYDAGFIENIFHKGCESGNQLMFVSKPEDDYSIVWLTEGEKKAIFSYEIIKQPFICIPGVSSFMKLTQKRRGGKSALDILKQRGTKSAVIAYDADRYKNDMVMNAMNGLANLLQNEGFNVYIADWEIKDGKGLDDLLSAGYLPSLMLVK